MRVFFLNSAYHLPPNMVSDYQADMVFHGLRSILGKDCVEGQRMWWMYAEDKEKNPEPFKEIWGKGFTMYGLLEDIIDPKASTVIEQFDTFVIPIHHYYTSPTQKDAILNAMKTIKRDVPNCRMAVIDGWDRTDFNTCLQFCRDNGFKYFKRECPYIDETVKPISFAFPEEKIPDLNFIKMRSYDIAPLIPVNQSIDPSYMSTYCYDDEERYYNMYQDSKFALTSKKGGWDTLRHYEIIANGAIPIFVDIDNCPEHTLWNFPKNLCKEVNFLSGLIVNLTNGQHWNPGMVLPHCGVVNKDNPGHWRGHWGSYCNLNSRFRKYLKEKLLTKHLAEYVLETMDEN